MASPEQIVDARYITLYFFILFPQKFKSLCSKFSLSFHFSLFYLHNAVSDTAVSDTNNSIIIKQAQGNAYFPQLN